MPDAVAVERGRLFGDAGRSIVRLCLAQMQSFGLVVTSLGVATSLLARVGGVAPGLRGALFGARGEFLERSPVRWSLVDVSRLAHMSGMLHPCTPDEGP